MNIEFMMTIQSSWSCAKMLCYQISHNHWSYDKMLCYEISYNHTVLHSHLNTGESVKALVHLRRIKTTVPEKQNFLRLIHVLKTENWRTTNGPILRYV